MMKTAALALLAGVVTGAATSGVALQWLRLHALLNIPNDC